MEKTEWKVDTVVHGIEKTVLFPNGGVGVPWSGIIRAEVGSQSDTDEKTVHYRGIPVMVHHSSSRGKDLRVYAYTSPDELRTISGTIIPVDGISFSGPSYGTTSVIYQTLDIYSNPTIHVHPNTIPKYTGITHNTKDTSPRPVEHNWVFKGSNVELAEGVSTDYLTITKAEMPAQDWQDIMTSAYSENSTFENFMQTLISKIPKEKLVPQPSQDGSVRLV